MLAHELVLIGLGQRLLMDRDSLEASIEREEIVLDCEKIVDSEGLYAVVLGKERCSSVYARWGTPRVYVLLVLSLFQDRLGMVYRRVGVGVQENEGMLRRYK